MFETLIDVSVRPEKKTDSPLLAPSDDMKVVLQKLDDLRELFKENMTASNYYNQDALMTITQTSQYCGFSKSFLYKLSASQEVTFYKPNGKTIFFMRSDVDHFLTRKKILSVDQIKEKAEQHLQQKLFTPLKRRK